MIPVGEVQRTALHQMQYIGIRRDTWGDTQSNSYKLQHLHYTIPTNKDNVLKSCLQSSTLERIPLGFKCFFWQPQIGLA